MKDKDKTKAELIKELKKLQQEYDSLNTSYEKEIAGCKRTEENLQESAMKLARLQKIGKCGNWEWNIVENSLEWSDELYRIWGVGKDFPLTYESINQMIHPDDREFNSKMIQELLANTNNGEFEFRITCPDGTIKNIFQSIETSHAPSGQPLRMFGIMQDITDRKLAEEALHASEEKHRAVVEQSTDGIVITDEFGTITIWNTAMEELTGLKRCNTIGKPIWEVQSSLIPDELITPELLIQLQDNTKKILESKMPCPEESREQLIKCTDGTYKVVQDSTFIFKAGEHVGLGAIMRDITNFKREEKALRENKQLLEKTFLSLHEAVFIIDANTTEILEANPAASTIFGYSRDDMLGRTTAFLHADESSLDEFRTRLLPAVEEKGFLFLPDFRMKRKNGKVFSTEHRVMPLENEHDQRIGWISVVHDITERKLAEEEIRKSKMLLEDLNKHLNEIRENERAVISREIHDQIGQSLTALKLDMNWLKKPLKNANPDTAAKLQGMIDLITNTIKDVQRISSDLRPGILDDLGLAAAIEWYSGEFTKRTRIRCNLKLNDSVPDDPTNSLVFFRVLQEALTNVIRHANASSVTIRLHHNQSGTSLTIQDNGTGIPKEKIESSRSLGLIGIRERVRQAGGNVIISSQKGKGTKLTVTIPEKKLIIS